MILFVLKKAFFDLWDNLFPLVIINLGYLVLIAVGFVVPLSIWGTSLTTLLCVLSAIVILSIYSGVVARFAHAVGNYETVQIKEALAYLKPSIVIGLQNGLLYSALVILTFIALPFYMSMQSLLGLLAASVIFWCAIIALLSFMYFLPISIMHGGSFTSRLKKCFLMFFDNPVFTLVIFIYAMLNLSLSFFVAMMIPSFSGVQLIINDAVKIRLLKYEYLEANPNANRRKIPWHEVMFEEEELVGKRSFKSMLFPWKLQ